ncbi:hypothetical protein H131_14183 [Lysinibacillus sphaericus OT4b.31]|uniref:Uncharacterized protein n=2 Tax=Bacillaceae TaxID=186817 RepID=R7ZDL5_LYSSH|nr:hypothetical protein H131_14183 [Lysinibacillus sphaericus OT4b.31]
MPIDKLFTQLSIFRHTKKVKFMLVVIASSMISFYFPELGKKMNQVKEAARLLAEEGEMKEISLVAIHNLAEL